MKSVNLTAETRADSGKKVASALRNEGKMPTVMYGLGKVEKLAVKSNELFKALSGEDGRNVVLEIGVDGGNSRHAILKELQYHPITDQLLHADFLEVDMEKPFKKKLEILIEGEPVGVKIKGGVLRFHTREVRVSAVPGKIPVNIVVNVAKMDINDRIKLSDIPFPDGVTVLDDPETKIVSIVPPKSGPGGKAAGTGESDALDFDSAPAPEKK